MNQPQLPTPAKAQLPALSTNSLRDEMHKKALMALSSGTVALSYATKAAKILVGQIPGPPLDDPAIYANGIAHALAAYPKAVIDECCDTRMGLPRKLERRPTPKQVMDWCDERVKFYTALAQYRPRVEKAVPVFTEEHKAMMREKLAELGRTLKSNWLTKLWQSHKQAPTDDELRAIYAQKEAAE